MAFHCIPAYFNPWALWLIYQLNTVRMHGVGLHPKYRKQPVKQHLKPARDIKTAKTHTVVE